jgi:hypothetical protein
MNRLIIRKQTAKQINLLPVAFVACLRFPIRIDAGGMAAAAHERRRSIVAQPLVSR